MMSSRSGDETLTKFELLPRGNNITPVTTVIGLIILFIGILKLVGGDHSTWVYILVVLGGILCLSIFFKFRRTYVVFEDQTQSISIVKDGICQTEAVAIPLGSYQSFIKCVHHPELKFLFTDGLKGDDASSFTQKKKMATKINEWWTQKKKSIPDQPQRSVQPSVPSAPSAQPEYISDPFLANEVGTGYSEGNIVENPSNVTNEKTERMSVWMTNTVELPEYTHTLIENGFDRMSMFENLSMEDLNLMGITKLGHKKKILSEVAKLKEHVSIEIADDGDCIPGAASPSSVSDPAPSAPPAPAYHSGL